MGNKVKSSSMPKVASIFTAKPETINLAIFLIEETSDTKYAVFSDSLSVLRQLQASTTDNHQVQQIWGCLQDLRESGKEVKLTCIPSHVGFKGNKLADAAAKGSPILIEVCTTCVSRQSQTQGIEELIYFPQSSVAWPLSGGAVFLY